MSRDLFLPRAPLFDAFDDLFDFDREFYRCNRNEKDMHPYDIINKENEIIITHNVLGIAKEDLNISVKTIKNKNYIVISGTTKDKITDKSYTINSRFEYNPNEIDVSKATSELINGILYITIPYQNKDIQNKDIQINIK